MTGTPAFGERREQTREGEDKRHGRAANSGKPVKFLPGAGNGDVPEPSPGCASRPCGEGAACASAPPSRHPPESPPPAAGLRRGAARPPPPGAAPAGGACRRTTTTRRRRRRRRRAVRRPMATVAGRHIATAPQPLPTAGQPAAAPNGRLARRRAR